MHQLDANNQIPDVELELKRKFTPKKLRTYRIAQLYQQVGFDQKSEHLRNCGTFLAFSEAGKLQEANFCKDRLCPMCAWRRALKTGSQVKAIVEHLKETHDFVFLTLTVRNCSADDLKQTVHKLLKDFTKFMGDKRCKKAFKGYFRALEITRNTDQTPDLEYHPHIHAICAVKKNYFRSKDYLDYKTIRSMWKKTINATYNPMVSIEKIRKDPNESDEIGLNKAVSEVAKYTLKTDELYGGDEGSNLLAVWSLTEALGNKRLQTFAGVFQEARKELNLDDLMDGDLIHVDQETGEVTNGPLTYYRWDKEAHAFIVFTKYTERR